MDYPKSIKNLIDYLTKLPTVGPKTAERYVFYLLNQNPELLQGFAQAIAELKEKTTVCRLCHAVSDQSPCAICADKKRDQKILAVVANTRDMLSIENSKNFHGYYHILGGLLDPINSIGPINLNIKSLVKKVENTKPQEIILALSPKMEGETTAHYLAQILKSYNIPLTRLARGLPMGFDLEYADEMTLANALKFRNKI